MDSPMEDAMPHRMAKAVALKTGQFKDADRAHGGELVRIVRRRRWCWMPLSYVYCYALTECIASSLQRRKGAA